MKYLIYSLRIHGSCVTQGSKQARNCLKANNFSGITVKKIPTIPQSPSILSRKVTESTLAWDRKDMNESIARKTEALLEASNWQPRLDQSHETGGIKDTKDTF